MMLENKFIIIFVDLAMFKRRNIFFNDIYTSQEEFQKYLFQHMFP